MFVIGSHLSISKGYLHMGKEATKIGGNTFQYFTRNPRGGGMRALDVEDMNSLGAYMKEHNFGTLCKGYLHMGKEATKIGGNTFQYFTRNPRGGSMRALDVEDMNNLSIYMKEHNFGTLLAHAPYTYNPCAAKEDLRAFAKQSMMEDLERMEYLPGQMYNFHPGSHVKQGVDQGIEYIVECLNEILFPGMKTTVLLEVMAGKGTEIGSRFEEIARIIDGVKLKEYMGVCVDTCHIHEGGYDICS